MTFNNRLAWQKGDTPKLLIVEFQSVARLLHLPIADGRVRRNFRQKGFYFRPSQIPAAPARKPSEKTSNPANAERDRLFLSASFPEVPPHTPPAT